MSLNAFAYRCIFTVYSGGAHPPIKVTCQLTEYQALTLMATPVKTVNVAVHRAGGIVMDETPEALDFDDGGNKPKIVRL